VSNPSDNVTVIIPAFNEEMTVGRVVSQINRLFPDFDTLVIDDGSTDNTVAEAQNAGARLLSLPFHCGGSVAVINAYRAALTRGNEYIVKIDADGQHDPRIIPRLLEPIVSANADIVVGSRFLRRNRTVDSRFRHFARWFSSRLVAAVWRLDLTDLTSGARAWTREALRSLLSEHLKTRLPADSVFWIAETALAIRSRLRIVEVEVPVLPRLHGKSKSFSPRQELLYPVRLLSILMRY